MKQITTFFFILLSQFCFAQITIHGNITESQTGKPLQAATITDEISEEKQVSDIFGNFTISTAEKKLKLKITYTGCRTYYITVRKNDSISIKLKQEYYEIEDVEIIAARKKHIEEMHGSVVSIPLKKILLTPVLGGETDILKTMQLLPGIQGGAEGASGLLIRGGSQDQNIILLDNIRVYNSSHLYGFLSAFNANAVSGINIYKAGFPAKYGGALSGVTEISLKKANLKNFSGAVSVGLISSQATLEIPLIKDRTSILLSGRTSYLSWLNKSVNIFKKTREYDNIDFGLYDSNLKISHKINPSSSISAGLFASKDWMINEQRDFEKDTSDYYRKSNIYWKNLLVQANYSAKINKNLKFSSSIGRVNYFQEVQTEEKYENIDTDSTYSFSSVNTSVTDYIWKNSFKYILEKLTTEIGIEAKYQQFSPSTIDFIADGRTENDFTVSGEKTTFTKTISGFVQANYQVLPKLEILTGIRYSHYFVDDTSFISAEPRISTKYSLTENFWLKAAYDRTSQNVHLLINNMGADIGTDLWVPATKNTGQQKANQFSAGIGIRFLKNYSAGIDIYKKRLSGLITYKVNSNLYSFAKPWHELIETAGTGTAQGIELWAEKKKGKLTGFASYTYSKSERTFQAIDYGKSYPFKYNRLHDFSASLQYKFTNNFGISANWVFMTGHSVTLPIGMYSLYQADSPALSNDRYYYGKRNSSRMPAYHRLDAGMQYSRNKKNRKVIWHFGLYNVYNRENAYFLRPIYDADNKKILIYKKALLPIIPSVKYEIRF